MSYNKFAKKADALGLEFEQPTPIRLRVRMLVQGQHPDRAKPIVVDYLLRGLAPKHLSELHDVLGGSLRAFLFEPPRERHYDELKILAESSDAWRHDPKGAVDEGGVDSAPPTYTEDDALITDELFAVSMSTSYVFANINDRDRAYAIFAEAAAPFRLRRTVFGFTYARLDA